MHKKSVQLLRCIFCNLLQRALFLRDDDFLSGKNSEEKLKSRQFRANIFSFLLSSRTSQSNFLSSFKSLNLHLQVASILLNGKKSGVLSNVVDEFEIDVVRNKIKLQMGKEKLKSAPSMSTTVACDADSSKVEESTSEPETTATQELGTLSVAEDATKLLTPEEMNQKFMTEIAMLEEKRKLMENYFRSRNMLPSSSKDKDRDEERHSSKHGRSSSKEKRHRDDRDRKKSESERSHRRHSSEDDRSQKHAKKKDRDRDDRKKKKKDKDKEREKDKDRDRKDRSREKDKKRHHRSKSRSRSREKKKKAEREKPPPPKADDDDDDDVLSFLEMMSELDKKNNLDFSDEKEKKVKD